MSYSSPVTEPKPMKKPQSLPWTHQETLSLIQAYQEKWYSLKRGQLKASRWEEVAVTVAARCGLFDDSAAKTALQCRHKMEKLRRRYRSERQTSPSSSVWPYYHAMEALEHGPLPISARPLNSMSCDYRNDEENDVVEEDEEDEEEKHFSERRGFDYVLQKPSAVNQFSGFFAKRVSREEEDSRVELAVEIRRFSERLTRMERIRMEMMQQTERFRMEMENRRIEMILDSQKKNMEVIAASLGSNKRVKLEGNSGI